MSPESAIECDRNTHHVRESARSWKLVVPMPVELNECVRALCDGLKPADAASLLAMLVRHANDGAEPQRAASSREVLVSSTPCTRDACC